MGGDADGQHPGSERLLCRDTGFGETSCAEIAPGPSTLAEENGGPPQRAGHLLDAGGSPAPGETAAGDTRASSARAGAAPRSSWFGHGHEPDECHGSRCETCFPTVFHGTTVSPNRFSQSRSRGCYLSRAATSGWETWGGLRRNRPVQPGSGRRRAKRGEFGIRSRHREPISPAGRQFPNSVCAICHASPHWRLEPLFARSMPCSQRSAAPPSGLYQEEIAHG